MNQTRRNNVIVAGLWLNAALLVAVLVGLVTRGDSVGIVPAAWAQIQPPAAAGTGTGVHIVPAQLASGHWGCYVLDLETRNLTVYQYQPGERLLRLVAARDIRHDLKLSDFNTAPSPQEISRMIERQQPAGRDRQE